MTAASQRKMGKQFRWKFDLGAEVFACGPKAESISAEQHLVGIYVVRVRLGEEQLATPRR